MLSATNDELTCIQVSYLGPDFQKSYSYIACHLPLSLTFETKNFFLIIITCKRFLPGTFCANCNFFIIICYFLIKKNCNKLLKYLIFYKLKLITPRKLRNAQIISKLLTCVNRRLNSWRVNSLEIKWLEIIKLKQ